MSPTQYGAVVAEWLSSWLAEQEDRGSIPGLATWIFRDWLSPASKSRYGWKIAKSTLILKTTNQPTYPSHSILCFRLFYSSCVQPMNFSTACCTWCTLLQGLQVSRLQHNFNVVDLHRGEGFRTPDHSQCADSFISPVESIKMSSALISCCRWHLDALNRRFNLTLHLLNKIYT